MKQKTVAIVAPTGMLGNMVYKELKNFYNLVLIYRDEQKLKKLQEIHGDTQKHRKIKFNLDNIYQDYFQSFPTEKIGPNTTKLINMIGNVDAVINCAGITKPHSLKDPVTTLFINGLLPNILSTVYKEKLIQIATDCVFACLSNAPYDEDAPKNPNDLYGISKSIGEPTESLVLRTSIIGPELDTSELLLDWFKKQKNKTINGFTNHLWNGITTLEFARICYQLIQKRGKFPKSGLFHIFSTSLTKYEMLKKFEDKYKINVIIKPTRTKIPIDRRLSTKYNFCKKLNIPSFDEMLKEL